jgi:hypothetical protein
MDLTKILKVGDKVYSPMGGYGIVTTVENKTSQPIRIEWVDGNWSTFTKEGKYYTFSPECMLFPSENNKDWSTWETEKKCPFKPFDKVLVRNSSSCCWSAEFFSSKFHNMFYCIGGNYAQCIPYNKETEHLVGTNQDCPDKYKI